MGVSASRGAELTEEDIEFLKNHTKFEEKTIRDWYEGFKEDCPSGKVTKNKFIEMYKMFFKSGDPDKFCEHIFRTFDIDGNGSVDFKEFLLAIGVTSNGSVEDRLKWAFRMYDINGDGLIQIPEMKKIVQALYDMIGPSIEELPIENAEVRTKAIFNKMDSNKDGKLTREEFISACMEDQHLMELLNVNMRDMQ